MESRGVARAMAVFETGLTQRFVKEFGLPWRVAPWGDGSNPSRVNILSDSHGVVVAEGLAPNVAYWIVQNAHGRAGLKDPANQWRRKVVEEQTRLGRDLTLDELLLLARGYEMTPEEVEAQRQSWTRQDKD